MSRQNLRQILALCLPFFMAACAQLPLDKTFNPDDEREAIIDSWQSTPEIQIKRTQNPIEIIRSGSIPEAIQRKAFRISLDSEFTLRDATEMLDIGGVDSMIADTELADKTFFMPSFSGNIGQFLNALSSAKELSVSYDNGLVVFSKLNSYLLQLPQHETIVAEATNMLSSLGAKDVSASGASGMIHYRADNTTQRVINHYLRQLRANTAVINVQMAVLSIALNQDRSTGFDWNSFRAVLGDFTVSENLNLSAAEGTLATVSNQNMAIRIGRGAADIQAALNLLSEYGNTRTMQNITLKTLSGVPVNIRSGLSTPFISDIPVTSTESTTTSGLDTEFLETGFSVEVNGLYNGSEKTVTLDLDLQIKTLVQFLELSAGNAFGTLSQPETRDQEFRSIVKLKAGETALLGGLIFETTEDNRTSISGLENQPIASQATSRNQNILFVLLRPTVTLFEQKGEQDD